MADDTGHQYQHVHRDTVTLPDGRSVVACSFPITGYQSDDPPDFGLYLDPIWQPPWPFETIDWPDFGLPADPEAMSIAMLDVLRRSAAQELVEIGCIGGHGRTGTALACLTALTGCAEDPVAWVRRVYCEYAIETDEQAELVRQFAGRV